MTIPRSFKLGAYTWKIRKKKLVNLYGLCDCDNHVIYISTYVDDRTTSDIEQLSTLIHELGHAVLHTMGKPDDEEFVRGVEELLLQVILTLKYPKKQKLN